MLVVKRVAVTKLCGNTSRRKFCLYWSLDTSIIATVIYFIACLLVMPKNKFYCLPPCDIYEYICYR